MSARRHRWSSRSVLGALAAALLALGLPGCRLEDYPQNALAPHSDYARWLRQLLDQQVFWVVVIFVVVMAALLVAVVRFRSRPGMPEPRPVHGHTMLEIAWTIAPAVILALIAVPTVVTIYKTQGVPPAGSLQVRVIGHQWWWEFQYPSLGVVTADEMHVPLGRPIAVDIETNDVIHSFWIPAMGGKRDAVPTHVNRIWFTPETLGTFPGQCAELCGISHANMRMKLMVDSREDFDAWVAHLKSPPVNPDTLTAAAQGKDAFMQVGCIACHTIDGVSAGVIGPNLTHVGSRTTIAGGTYENTADNLSRWIQDPQGRKPGALMLKLPLDNAQITALVAYMQSLR